MIGSEEHSAAGPTVDEGRLDRSAQVGLRGHVTDGIVNEDAVELAPEPEGPHVPLDVLGLRVELPAPGEHARSRIDERHAAEVSFEVRSVVATAAPELEQ